MTTRGRSLGKKERRGREIAAENAEREKAQKAMKKCSVFDLVALGGEDKIALRQAVDLMGPKLDLHFAVREEEIGVMPFLFGDFSDLVCEGKGFGKVGKGILFLQMVLVDDAPAVAELFLQRGEGFALEGRDASFAGDAGLFG